MQTSPPKPIAPDGFQTREIISVDPREDPVWERLVSRHQSSIFHSPSWIRAVTETYGWSASAHVVLDGIGEPVAGVPYCVISDVLGQRVSILPFSDYCDPIAATPGNWDALLGRLLSGGSPVALACLRNSLPLANCTASSIKQARWHGIDLRPDLDTVWGRFDHAAKGNVAKARREGVSVRYAEEESDMRTFFEMHLRVRKYKHHLLAQPYAFFEEIWEHIVRPGNGVLMLATLGDQVIAGGLFLEWKDVLYYKFNTSASEFLNYRPNDLLIWEAICYGKSKGHVELDFGRTDWDHEELARYKKKFGAKEGVITGLRYQVCPTSNEQEQLKELLPQLTDLLTDAAVPDRVTERAGALLYRFFV